MPSAVLGLPTHVLVIHAVVVGLPLTALLLVLSAFSARLRARAGVLLPLAGIVMVPVTGIAQHSGEELEAALPSTPAIQAHAAAGDRLLLWAIGVALLCVAVWWFGRRAAGSRGIGGSASSSRPVRELAARSPLSIGLAVLATAVAVGAIVEVAYIGHLGAEAAWGYVADLPAK